MSEFDDAREAFDEAGGRVDLRSLARGEEWDPEKALAALDTAQIVHGMDEAKVAEELLVQALPLATMQLIFLAQHSSNERIRGEYSKYIVERNLGTVKDANPLMGKKDPLYDLVNSITAEDRAVDEARKKLADNKPTDGFDQ